MNGKKIFVISNFTNDNGKENWNENWNEKWNKKEKKRKKKASISIFENGLKYEWNGRGKLLYTLIGKERETERSREREKEKKER